MSEPEFVPVDLTELQDEGVLLAANEVFFWRLGLALTWDHDSETGKATNLHIREWVWPTDDHHEPIELASTDEMKSDRHARYYAWLAERMTRMQP